MFKDVLPAIFCIGLLTVLLLVMMYVKERLGEREYERIHESMVHTSNRPVTTRYECHDCWFVPEDCEGCERDV